MPEDSDSKDEILIRYLLNETSKSENEDLEDEMVLDDELSDRMQTVEMLLIDRYVSQEMSSEEKIRFEQGFLLFPENRDKVEDARIFRESLGLLQREGYLVQPSLQKKSWGAWFTSRFGSPILSPAFAVLALLLIGVIVFLILNTNKTHDVVNVNRNISNNTNPLTASRNENSNDGKNSPLNENIEQTNAPSVPTPNGPSATSTPVIAQKSPVVKAPVAIVNLEERSGTTGQNMGSGKSVQPQPRLIPRDSEIVRFNLELKTTVIANRNSKIPIQIQTEKLKEAPKYQASLIRIPGPPQLSPQYKLSVDIPTARLKDNETYYFVIPKEPDGYSRTPFKIIRIDRKP